MDLLQVNIAVFAVHLGSGSAKSGYRVPLPGIMLKSFRLGCGARISVRNRVETLMLVAALLHHSLLHH
jgi:hypothetical protein